MLNSFLAALAKKLVELSGNKKSLKEAKFPQVFIDYLNSVGDDDFLKDMALILKYISGEKNSPEFAESLLFKAISEFLTGDFASKLDFIDGEVSLYKEEKRREIVEKLIGSDSEIGETLRNILLSYTYHQIAAEIQSFIERAVQAPYILIQSPREVDVEQKREIRKKLREKDDNAFPIFQTNQKLIGGIRVFKNGETIDHSWLSRVFLYTSLTKA